MSADADPARVLGTVEAECLRPTTGDEAYLVEVGRAAFRTPLLLGGQAARAGIACDSCHQGGRRNPDFAFPGLSGAPGTADVTTALFSSHRDDGIDNPIPIPDLGGPKVRLRIPQDPASLQHFIHGQVTEEFNGAEPPPAVLQGLAAYVRALDPGACPADERRALLAGDYAADAARAVRAAMAALEHKDAITAALMLEAARSRLGLIYERYDQPEAGPARAFLKSADADLAAALERVRHGDGGASQALAAWLVRLGPRMKLVTAEEAGSLFAPARLRR
ncbi:hypothetical protein [Phenylobacterium montanum]|uniref:Cytochrome c domain-containing protein n=1 Tax=Phenylobacterium montanum TaxID=2823693 RepID=A0A975FYM4_9CAUL|nr:hypothetical protein [Caulobacter sp. S6]QUD87830.1 hypothetical protein KCG34_22765 [Caulobacter sp. S6]